MTTSAFNIESGRSVPSRATLLGMAQALGSLEGTHHYLGPEDRLALFFDSCR